MSDKSRKWTWMIVGAGAVAVAALPQRSLAQCNTYSSTYATERVRIDYGPAYRGPATYTTVARPYVQPVRRVVRSEPVYAPVQCETPVVVYVDNDRHYRHPTRRIYRSSHRRHHYVPSVRHGLRTRHHNGHRRAIVHRSHSGHGHRGFGVSISAGRSHHGRRHGGVSFSYRR